jgi:hypothetical protein
VLDYLRPCGSRQKTGKVHGFSSLLLGVFKVPKFRPVVERWIRSPFDRGAASIVVVYMRV